MDFFGTYMSAHRSSVGCSFPLLPSFNRFFIHLMFSLFSFIFVIVLYAAICNGLKFIYLRLEAVIIGISFIHSFTSPTYQRFVFWHQEVASDSFCFLINSSWLLVFILYVFSIFFLGFNLYCWKGIHFS